MLKITKSYILDENQQPVAVQIPIAEFEQIEKILEKFGLTERIEEMENREQLSDDIEDEPYDWEPGEIGEGYPVKYIPGKGIVVIKP
ncbi:hypothetical protein [Coleofasciculus sp. H7-2]|uniref:hypothetical protein n=1 Tax=Coleofasciculus sp. H7-2 TaxID=3351545 RepID=UPI00366D05DB